MMKKIELRKGITIETEDDQWHELNLDELRQKMKEVGDNKLLIIEAAYDIERQLETVITYYFFERHEINQGKSKIFSDQILRSSWCSFASKQSLIRFLLDDSSVFPNNQEREDYIKVLKKVMSYRNAFTHGELVSRGNAIKLTWFEGTTRTEFLTDEYLTEIEYDFKKCKELTYKVAFKIGALTLAESLEEPLIAGQVIAVKIDDGQEKKQD